MANHNQDFLSLDKSSKKFESILGFDFNYPYLSPKKVQNKIQIDNEEILAEMAKHIVAVRKLNSKNLSLPNIHENHFWYFPVPQMEEFLFILDKESSIYSYTFEGLDLEKNFFEEFLFSECFFSLKVEGLSVTYRRANDILLESASPEQDDELLLINYYQVLKTMFEENKEPISNQMIKELYSSLYQDVQEEKESGLFRKNSHISFTDALSGIHGYRIVNEKNISIFLNELTEWLNDHKVFFHPILKGTILYFYLLYLQPFPKGNGIIARLLFYYYLHSAGYGIMKFLSLSEMIDQDKGKYTNAFEESIHNGGDITYFLIYVIESLYQSFNHFKKSSDNEAKWLKNQQKINQMHIAINERQLKIMRGFSLDKYQSLSTEKVEKMCQVGSDTARKDLNELVKWKLLKKEKDGKSFNYIPLDY